jgi:thiol-disulfide isomerase/thioredoxin
MKIAASVLALAFTTMALFGTDIITPTIPIDAKALVDRARAYMRALKPEVDSGKLEFIGIMYRYEPMPDGYIEVQKDRSEEFVKVADFNESLGVTFKLLGSEIKTVENGRECTTWETLGVNFPDTHSPKPSVSPGKMTQYGKPPQVERPKIYDESADGSKQIDEAVSRAGKEGKYVLLQFGANWCDWCHKLHELFETDASIKRKLQAEYVVVLVDVNKGHNERVVARFGHPTRLGLPVMVVLDSQGNKITTQDTGQLEEAGKHDPGKVMAFLDAWAPKK